MVLRKRTSALLVSAALALSAGATFAGGQSPSDAGHMSTYGGGLSSDVNVNANAAGDSSRAQGRLAEPGDIGATLSEPTDSTASVSEPQSASSATDAAEASAQAQSDITALTGNGNTTGAGTALSSAEPSPSASSSSNEPSSNEARSSDDIEPLGPNWRGSMPETSSDRGMPDRRNSVKL